jgi:hypothetical protein
MLSWLMNLLKLPPMRNGTQEARVPSSTRPNLTPVQPAVTLGRISLVGFFCLLNLLLTSGLSIFFFNNQEALCVSLLKFSV